jgi:hypothetical protein
MVFLGFLCFPIIIFANDKGHIKNIQKKQIIMELCQVNADLVDQLKDCQDEEEAKLGINFKDCHQRFFYDHFGNSITSIPSNTFFLMFSDIIRRNSYIKYTEVIGELLIDYMLLRRELNGCQDFLSKTNK